jgi:hypothetical protein
MTYILNTNRFRSYKLTFSDWFRLIEELAYEIVVRLQEKFLTNFKPRLQCTNLGWVIF